MVKVDDFPIDKINFPYIVLRAHMFSNVGLIENIHHHPSSDIE